MTETLGNVADGFAFVFSGGPLLAAFIGVFVGSLVGALPGIGPIPAMAVLLPLSFAMDVTSAVLMLAGIYFGAMFGNSTASILMRVPGDAAGVVTSIDGHEMTKNGRAGAALAIAAIASFAAGTFAVVALMLAAPPISAFAIRFSAPEFFALTLFAILVLSRLSGASFAKTMVSVALGLALATIGLDQLTGNIRFTFGQFVFAQGLHLTAVAVGLFGIAEVLLLAERRGRVPDLPSVKLRDLPPTKQEFRRAVPAILRGGPLGFCFGLIPGPAAVMATYAIYSLEKMISKHKDQFGKGAVEGVAGPEAANNGASGGAMVPVLLLGIPFTAPAAMLLAGFIIHGITPGPFLIRDEPELFWGLIAGLYIANFMLLILNGPLVTIFTTMLRIPRDILLAAVIALAIVGAYVPRNSVFDVAVLIVMGLLGYIMAKLELPRTALILAFVIGGLMESSLVQTLTLANGNPAYIFDRPIALTILIVTVLVLLAPGVLNLFRRGESRFFRTQEELGPEGGD